MRPFLTVLTAPVPSRARLWYQEIRRAVRPYVKPRVPLPAMSPYPGHFAVTRSVVEGLRASGADFNFNPRRLDHLARVVYAPANEALMQCIVLKRRRVIDYLVAGPVNALYPTECDGILLHPEINRIIVASDWVRELFRTDAPQLLDKLRTCPCGVDTQWWMPSHRAAVDRRMVVYWKSGSEEFCRSVEHVIAGRGFAPVRVTYGGYERESYRNVLDGAEGAVFLSSFETQGLALAEAWSMNVPTLVWDPRGLAEWRGRTFRAGSSAPFLTAETGIVWARLEDLGGTIDALVEQRRALRPRAWVLAHMTDAICAARLLSIVSDGVQGRAA